MTNKYDCERAIGEPCALNRRLEKAELSEARRSGMRQSGEPVLAEFLSPGGSARRLSVDMFHRVDGRCAPQDPTKDEARSSGDPPRRNRGPTRRVCARRSHHLTVPSTHSGWPTEVKVSVSIRWAVRANEPLISRRRAVFGASPDGTRDLRVRRGTAPPQLG